MTTKAQERKALEQIRKIVEGLGEDSYIGMAFEGVFEIAADNIENDFGNSPKASIEHLRGDLGSTREELAEAKRNYEERTKNLSHVIDARDRIIEDKNNRIEDLREQLKDATNQSLVHWNNFREQEDKVEQLQMEIIRLKARLFDMMEAQGA